MAFIAATYEGNVRNQILAIREITQKNLEKLQFSIVIG